jgi:hypothetical protein
MLMWYLTGAAAAFLVAWLAAMLHIAGKAPLGIISLAVGIVLGAVLSAVAATDKRWQASRVAARSHLVVGTALLALLAVLAQHAWLYRDFRRQWHEARARSAAVAMFRPESPWSPVRYLAHELTPERAALWALDAALIIGAAVCVVMVWQRKSQVDSALRPTPKHLNPEP